ncbi:unannotated protein [freshwater metagenome]|uniref:Unannotated protein n=1 Tax=freshwater metagenome TaxID=449393 RepID=A0A6J6JET4_9ZZZZ
MTPRRVKAEADQTRQAAVRDIGRSLRCRPTVRCPNHKVSPMATCPAVAKPSPVMSPSTVVKLVGSLSTNPKIQKGEPMRKTVRESA